LVGPRPRSWPRTVLLLLGAALIALLAWVIVRLPQAIPPEPLAQGLIAGAPKLDTGGLPAEKRALLERGAYLYRTTSCLFCHGASGAGGNSISWKPFGTLYVRNITSDPETGIGAWTDAQVARAIRSGVSRHGRQLHWQGMIWDLLSNIDEEDLRAIIAYLRTLPAVHQAIPSSRAPAADDCEVYTFYTRGPFEPGCP
jgi:mono/diheme cytochrome c family protein